MNVTPTTTATILGGTETANEWGDPIEGSTEIASGIPFAVHEQPRKVVAPEHATAPMVVRFYTGYLPHGTQVTGANRIRDERSGTVYQIDHASTPAHPGRPQDVQLDLRTVE